MRGLGRYACVALVGYLHKLEVSIPKHSGLGALYLLVMTSIAVIVNGHTSYRNGVPVVVSIDDGSLHR